MKKTKSFSEYLNTRSADYAGLSKLKLNEAILQTAFTGTKTDGSDKPDTTVPFAKQVDAFVSGRWTGLSPVYVMEIMKFSSDWKDEYDTAELDVELSQGEDPHVIQFERLKFDRQQTGGGFKIEMKFPGKMQGFMMMTIKKMFPDVVLKFGNGLMTGQVQDEERAANVFNIAKKLISGVNPKANPIQKIGGKDQLDPADAEEYGKCVTAQAGGGKMAKTRISGPAAEIAEYVARRMKETPDDIKAPADYALTGIRLTLNTTKLTYPMTRLVDMFADKPFAKSPDTYEIRQALDALHSSGFGIAYNSYIRNLMYDIGKQVSDKKIDPKTGIQKITDEIYACTPEKIAEQNAKNSKVLIGRVNEPPQVNAASKPAVRRMKLFKDAEFYGAQIISNSKWIAAINRTYDQAHCFGRNKPKVDEKGNIIEKANLRDDEMADAGMTPEEIQKYKAIRDGDGRYVQDDIEIATAYNQPNEQRIEATWCVASNHGANKSWNANDAGRTGPWTGSYFKCRVAGERMPLITYMDCTNGRLYCSNLKYNPGGAGEYNDGFKIGDGWVQYDFNTECNGQGYENKGGDGGLKGKLKNDPLFKDVYERANDESFRAYTAYYGKNRAQKMEFKAISQPPKPFGEENKAAGDILKEFKTTKNGTVICKSKSDVMRMVPMAARRLVSAIKLEFTDASGLFRDGNAQDFSVIDCSMVENADDMFRGAQVPADLQLVSTARCKRMEKMFYGARGLKQIYGLDTQQTQTIDSIFRDSETPRQRPFYIQTLDLQNCKRCDYAFAGSAIEMITLRNFNPASAKEMFDGCFQLKTMPDLKTKHELSPVLFGVDRWINVFDGCDRLQENHAEFVKAIKELEEYHTNIMSLEKDERGFVILKEESDFDQYMFKPDIYGYNIRLSPAGGDASEFFAQSEYKINIDTLDMQDVKVAQSLFDGSKISHIGKIINCNQLTDCRYMFRDTGIAAPPNMELPNVQYIDGLFEGCSNLRNIKNGDKLKTIFGGENVVLPKDVKKTEDVVALIFGHSAQAITGRVDPVGTRFEEWLKPIMDNRETAEAHAFVSKLFITERDKIKINDIEYNSGLVITSAHDYAEYVRLNKVKPDIVKKQEIVIFNPTNGDADSMFAQKTVDFQGMELVFGYIKDASGMFLGAHIKGIGKISGTENIKDAPLMFKDAVVDKLPAELKFDKLTNAESMFENTQVEHGGIGVLSLPEVTEASNMFKNSAALGVKDGTVDLLGTFGEGWFNHAGLNAYSMFQGLKRKIKFGRKKFGFDGTNACSMFADTEIVESDGIQIWISGECLSAKLMFANTKSLKEISSMELELAGDCSSMFAKSELASAGEIKIKAKLLQDFFYECKELEWIGDFQILQDCSAKDMFNGTPLEPVYGKDAEFLRAALGV